jgi:quercetin dioxygenase-like cupin family protein
MNLSHIANPPVPVADDDPVTDQHAGGTPADIAPGYALDLGEGPATWFQGGILTMKARHRDTDGQFGLVEFYQPRGSVAPGHIHHNEAEGFYVLEGTLRIGVGDTVYERGPGSYIYVPKQTVHDWVVLTAYCRFLVFIAPGGFEHFFEELGEPALSATYPYTDHPQPGLEEVMDVGQKYGWSPGEGPQHTDSSAPPTVGRLEPRGS